MQIEISAAACAPSRSDRTPLVGKRPLRESLASRCVEDQLAIVERTWERAQRSKRLRRHHDSSRLAVLRWLDAALAIERAADCRAAVRYVEVAPAQSC